MCYGLIFKKVAKIPWNEIPSKRLLRKWGLHWYDKKKEISCFCEKKIMRKIIHRKFKLMEDPASAVRTTS
jgi:hypothetical protein